MHEDTADSREERLVNEAWNQSRRVRRDARSGWLYPWSEALAHYELIEEVHRGGQGVVFRALQESTQRLVAIKIFHGGAQFDSGILPRFEREVRVLAALKHPNIVTVHDSGVAAGYAYVVMDFIRGVPLDRWLAEHAETTGKPATVRDGIRRIAELFVHVCRAVNEAHLRGVIHRDLKPGNILIDSSGEPHILDFGLAKLLDEQVMSAEEAMTATGLFVGSAPWASPEQADGPSDTIDLRTDVYALGVMLYKALTGEFPYPVSGPVREVLRNIELREPPPPRSVNSAVDHEIETIVLRCLAKDPERRYQTAGDLGRDIERYLAGEPIEAKRDSLPYIMRKRLRRHRVAVVTAGVFVVVLASATVTAWSLYLRAEESSLQARAAQQEAVERLWDVYQTQARATRLSRHAGRRVDSLALLQQAAAIKPSLDIRNEALAALALSDLEVMRTLEVSDFSTARGLRKIDRFATRAAAGGVTVHAAEDGSLLASLSGPTLHTAIMHFSPRGQFLAVKYHTDDNIELWVWDLHSPDPHAVLKSKTFADGAIGFDPASPVAQWIAVGEAGDHIHIYELPSGRTRQVIELAATPGRLSIHPSGQRLAIACASDPCVHVRSIATGEIVAQMTAPYGMASLAWSADGRYLAGGCYDHRVYVWDGQSGAQRMTLTGHQSPAVEMFFDQQNRFLASFGWDNTTRLWDLDRGVQLIEPIEQWQVVGIGDDLMTWRRSNELRVWHFAPSRGYRELRAAAGFRGADFGMDQSGTLLAWAGENGLLLWDLADRRGPRVLHEGHCRSALFLPEHRGLLAVTPRGVEHWPAEDISAQGEVPAGQLVWAQLQLRDVGMQHNGNRVVGCTREALLVYDMNSRKITKRLNGHRGMTSVAVSSDERWIVTGTWKGDAACLWDVRSGEIVERFAGNNVVGVFSPNGRWLAIADGHYYHFIEVGTWVTRHRVPRRHLDGSAGAVTFGMRSEIVALMSTRYEVQLFETATWTTLATLPNPGNHALSNMRFGADDRYLVISTADDVIQLWDVTELRHALMTIGLDWAHQVLSDDDGLGETE